MIIGFSGKIGAGKDTCAKLMQYLLRKQLVESGIMPPTLMPNLSKITDYTQITGTGWEVKKFAFKLKQVVGLLTGYSPFDFEKQEVKDRVLGEEWWYWAVFKTSKRIPFIGNEDFNKTDLSVTLIKPTVRQLLQEIGTDAMRDVIHPDAWVNALFTDYKGEYCGSGTSAELAKELQQNWIITDVRFPNEFNAVRNRGGMLIRVERDDLFRLGYIDKHPHSSETALDGHSFDFVIYNNDNIDYLLSQIDDILITTGIYERAIATKA
jgi:hypothetical protein